jgi:hypothetical protein
MLAFSPGVFGPNKSGVREMDILSTAHRKTMLKTVAITPSALLLGLFFVEHAWDFLMILVLGWGVAYLFATHLSRMAGSFRHFFAILAVFVADTLWGLIHLFPLPDWSNESPFLLLLIFTMLTGLMLAFITCGTFLYARLEAILLKRFV